MHNHNKISNLKAVNDPIRSVLVCFSKVLIHNREYNAHHSFYHCVHQVINNGYDEIQECF